MAAPPPNNAAGLPEVTAAPSMASMMATMTSLAAMVSSNVAMAGSRPPIRTRPRNASPAPDPRPAPVFTNMMRDRQARGKDASVEEKHVLWSMQQKFVNGRLRLDQQRRQQFQQLQIYRQYQDQSRQHHEASKEIDEASLHIGNLQRRLRTMHQEMSTHPPGSAAYQSKRAECDQVYQTWQKLQNEQRVRLNKHGQQKHKLIQMQRQAGGPMAASTTTTYTTAAPGGSSNPSGGSASEGSGVSQSTDQGPYWSAMMEASVEFDPDDFESLALRRHAQVVLDTPELLMMYSQSTGDTIPATRFKFMRIMCGYDDDIEGNLTGGIDNKPVRERPGGSKSKSRDAGGQKSHRRKRED